MLIGDANKICTISNLQTTRLQFHDEFIPGGPSIARSDLNEKRDQSVAIDTISSSPIYPCAIGASMVDAFALVRSLYRCAVVVMCAGADFAGHAVGETNFGIRSHACAVLASSTARSSVDRITIVCTIEAHIGDSLIAFDPSGFL